MEIPLVRCVNIDWLEVYVNEDNMKYPMNADYFRSQGYFVTERDYGTRVYSEMFTIQNAHGDSWIEVRRNPMSGASSFTGLSERSCHLRLVNRQCYTDTPMRDLVEFMVKHDYIFVSIFRLDLCYDFKKFDSGDKPETFLQRYIEKKFSKVNQTKVRSIGDDNWGAFAWESISWGAHGSMVSTKIYNKTKELAATGNKKPWIVQAWWQTGLIDDVQNLPNVWRLEFSMRSSIKNWIVLDVWTGKRIKKQRVPHQPSMFQDREMLWQRFEELAYHYFHFRYVEYKKEVNSEGERELLRKDLCRDKKLFWFNLNRQFYQIDNPSHESSPSSIDEQLRRALMKFQDTIYDPELTRACNVLLDYIDKHMLKRFTKHGTLPEIEEIRMAIATRTGWDYKRVNEQAEKVMNLIKEHEIW